MKIGIDAGVGNIKVVYISDNSSDLEVQKTEGRPFERIVGILENFKGRHDVAITGVEGKSVAEVGNIRYVNHALAVKAGFQVLHPEARTVFDIGKENSNYYLFNEKKGELTIVDFSTNSLCGAGGGALIEKMAGRLEFPSLDDFVKAAYDSENVSNIAGRCGVFAESDVVHHFQRGSQPDSIASGLCQMLARNFQVNVLQGKKIIEPVYLIGGVSKNIAVVEFLQRLLEKEIIIPEDQEKVKSYGTALNSKCLDVGEAVERLKGYEKKTTYSIPKLGLEKSVIDSRPYKLVERKGDDRVLLSLNPDYAFGSSLDFFMGLDVGSVSTKAAVIDKNGEFVFGIYKRTGGKPIDAVIDVINRIGKYVSKNTDTSKILGVGVTGSGRYVAAEIIGADVVRNEITAQAAGARFFVEEVDTVFEIGGQDSKYIYLENGKVVDNEMNKACAASTGSFLEEQAKLLGIKIEKEFEEYALRSDHPCSLSEKCAILMASSLAHYHDSPVEDKCAGLTYSVCNNFLNRVVGKKKIGQNIVFQGAVAFNRAVVSGFETILNTKIYVPTYPHLTGAVGIAKIAGENYDKV